MREIVLVILSTGKTNYQLLTEHVKPSRSTLSSYLKYLVTNRILVKEKTGFENLYTVKDEERVTKVLTAYNPSFLDKLVDSALAFGRKPMLLMKKRGKDDSFRFLY